MGNEGRTAAGDVQVMSAGTGVMHSEFNLEDEETTLFQIWIESDRPGAAPGWAAMPFPREARAGKFVTLASGDADDGTPTIHADARLLGATLRAGGSIAVDADPARHLYLVASAPVTVNGVEAGARDGIAITGEERIAVEAGDADAELVLVDAR
jgi:redox-sensitive bicupin YhaK (pirin superfamily)